MSRSINPRSAHRWFARRASSGVVVGLQVTADLPSPKEKQMHKHSYIAAGAGLLVATTGLFGMAAAASASPASPVVGYTYVNDNTAVANTIAGFDRHADGSLTPIPGSPFQAGGAGLGSGLASQGAIQVTANGRYLLAVDAGSNQNLGVAYHRGRRTRACRPARTFGRGQASERGRLLDRSRLCGELRRRRQRLFRLPPQF